jgi:hypothetical protein
MSKDIEITDELGRCWVKIPTGYRLKDDVTNVIPIAMKGNLFPAGNFNKKKL